MADMDLMEGSDKIERLYVVKPLSLEKLRWYFDAMSAGDVPDPALALYGYLKMDGFIVVEPKSGGKR